jgi:hypothetical protein
VIASRGVSVLLMQDHFPLKDSTGWSHFSHHFPSLLWDWMFYDHMADMTIPPCTLGSMHVSFIDFLLCDSHGLVSSCFFTISQDLDLNVCNPITTNYRRSLKHDHVWCVRQNKPVGDVRSILGILLMWAVRRWPNEAFTAAQTDARAHQSLRLWPRVILNIAHEGKGDDKPPFQAL